MYAPRHQRRTLLSSGGWLRAAHQPRRPDRGRPVPPVDEGRPDADNVIIFFADGQANQPTSTGHPCQYANDAATSAKLAGTAIYSLGYGVDTTRCGTDSSGPFVNRYGTYFLASTSGIAPDQGATDSSPGGCAATENTDQDYYFCEGRGEDLDAVFRQIASQIAQRSRLLNF